MRSPPGKKAIKKHPPPLKGARVLLFVGRHGTMIVAPFYINKNKKNQN
jgi:hypothetical protein